MALIVEMWGIPAEQPKNRFFQCGGNFWKQMLDLGKRYGWVPKGTVPYNAETEETYKKTIEGFQPDYDPQEYRLAKRLFQEDAEGWAEALERAVSDISFKEEAHKGPVLLREDMTEEDYEQANRAQTKGNIIRFAEFLKRGGFAFAWDD